VLPRASHVQAGQLFARQALFKTLENSYQKYLQQHQQVLGLSNESYEEVPDSPQIKKVLVMNKLEMYLFKNNCTLFEKLGVKLFWDHGSSANHDLFLKNIEMCVTGEAQSIQQFTKII